MLITHVVFNTALVFSEGLILVFYIVFTNVI